MQFVVLSRLKLQQYRDSGRGPCGTYLQCQSLLWLQFSKLFSFLVGCTLMFQSNSLPILIELQFQLIRLRKAGP